ncbi:MAG: DEAD/DEAH box helicase family protein [Muribaculaceae bacterium]|nr:DEAD/DEAH box helicase family protein [Muribaculaceae bacterium]
MELKRYQQEAVNELVKLTKRYLNGNARKIYLEAPTGAGKTVIASAAMEQIAASLPYDHDCATDKVAFIWIAPNKLHQQSYLSMKSYFRFTNYMRPIVWDEVDQKLGHLEHGDVLFLNWPSINSDNNLIWRQTETGEDLLTIINNTRDNNTPIVVVIDEEQNFAGANKEASKAAAVLARVRPDVEIRISATPKYPSGGGFQQIVIDRADVVREQMIKKDVIINAGVKDDEMQQGEVAYFVDKALQKRADLQQMYAQIGSPVNPLLLIQLPNDNQKLDATDNAIMAAVKAYLAHPDINITEQNERLAIWLNENRKNLDQIAAPNSLTEVLLFKEAISKGWDCPRAAVLLIFREMKSYVITVQTVGRILRMPQQKFYTNDALNHGYVYTNLQNDYIEIRGDEMDYMQRGMVEATLRRNIVAYSLPARSIGVKKVQNTLGYQFRRVLRDTFVEMWQLNRAVIDFGITDEPVVVDPDAAPSVGSLFAPAMSDDFLKNRAMLVANAGLDLDVHRLYSVFPKDMTIDPGHVGRYDVPQNGRASLARTQGEVDRLFRAFCMANLIKFDKRDSTAAMSEAILEFMRRFAGYTDDEAKRIVLFHKNRPEFVKVLKRAQERYDRALAERMKKAKSEVTPYDWQLPSSRAYKVATHHPQEAPAHALQPFYELNSAFDPEKRFRDFLNRHNESILWWYKNGDSGREHFSIIYQNADGKQANFYVDFIIMLRNGRVCLFDTKDVTGGIGDTVAKHNALVDYVNERNKQNATRMVGGIIVEDGGQWLYSPLHISDAGDHGGWSVFNPDELND